MRFVSARDFRGKSGQIWKSLVREKEMVITSNGKPVALVSHLSEERMEETINAVRRALALESLTALQSQSARAGFNRVPLSEINQEIKRVRQGRCK